MYTSELEKLGFKLNAYDKFLANKVMNGNQCTIAWNIDDNKISHVSKEVVNSMIKKLESYFREFTVTNGDEHKDKEKVLEGGDRYD